MFGHRFRPLQGKRNYHNASFQNSSSLLLMLLLALVDRIHCTNSVTTKTTRLAYNALRVVSAIRNRLTLNF